MIGENFFLQPFILPPTTSSSITKKVPEPIYGEVAGVPWEISSVVVMVGAIRPLPYHLVSSWSILSLA
jgi:hypothetical protein